MVVLMDATDNNHQTTDQNLTMASQDQENHQPTRRSSGRRKTKAGCNSSQKKNKQPMRGMGVEKLERIRLQERWKQMTEIPSTSHGFTAMAGPVAPMGLNPARGYVGFHGQMGFGGFLPPSHDHLLQTDFWPGGSLNHTGFVGKNVAGRISKELPSTPNNATVHCYPQHCNACHKKKKVDGSENSRGRSEMYMQMCSGGDCGFLGLNIGSADSKNNINQEKQGRGGKGSFVPHLGYAVGNGNKQVVAVHKRGSSSSDQNGSVLMEYEFFPSAKSCSRSSDSHNDDGLMVMKVVGGSSETSPSSSSLSSCLVAGFDATSSVDLSLKLSY